MLTLHADSHVDHDLTREQVDYLLERFKDRTGEFVETVELPEALGEVPCALHGPAVGDAPVPEAEVSYGRRGARQYRSRLTDRPPRRTRKVTVIAGEHKGAPCVWFTAFGGPPSPQEPSDPGLPAEKVADSEAFWREHALSA